MPPLPDWKGRWVRFWRRLIEAETRPHALAMGFAVGLFFASLPIVGQALLAALVAVPLRANKAVAVGLTFLNNPFTMVPYLSVATWFGAILLPERSEGDLALHQMFADFHWENILSVGGGILYPMLVGSFAIGIGLAVPAYFLVRFVAERRTTRMRSMPK